MLHDRVRTVIAQVLQQRPAELPDEPSSDVLADWDSLRHLMLMLALEEEFGTTVEPEVSPRLRSLSTIVAYLDQQQAHQP